jgi:hypothetical protein
MADVATTDDAAQGTQLAGPILIIGTERSGSNLLRLILNANSQVAIPHPPHFFRYFASLVGRYGNLSQQASRESLVRDALLLLRRHIHPWPHRIDPDVVLARSSTTLWSVVAAIYDEFRRAEGKARWGCKSTFTVEHIVEVHAQCPDAQFIWLVRDPRDVALSSKHAVFNPCHPYLTARLWQRQQLRAQAALEAFGPGSVHLLRYEDLVRAPREQITALCDFLDIPFESAMLAHHMSAEARETAQLSESWRNAQRPISDISVGAYRTGLRKSERQQVEAVAGDMMRRLGYVVDSHVAATRMPSIVAAWCGDLLMRVRVEYRSMRRDRNHWRRWARGGTVWWLRCRTGVEALLRQIRQRNHDHAIDADASRPLERAGGSA